MTIETGESQLRIEDYAVIGDCRSAALVGTDGSIDWLCWPRFDSPACFAALLGGPEYGRWLLGAAGDGRRARNDAGVGAFDRFRVTRGYRPETLILETDFASDDSAVRVVDFMPITQRAPALLRRVAGLRGRATVRGELVPRFDYGAGVPTVRLVDANSAVATHGSRALTLRSERPLDLLGDTVVCECEVATGESVTFALSFGEPPSGSFDFDEELAACESFWRDWSARCSYAGEYRDAVVRSLLTLKALTYAPTGGIIAAPTTSLPQQLGGVRNWDYRYCWLRDASLVLRVLMAVGYYDEADDWRAWLLGAVGGDSSQVQVVYGIDGKRNLAEGELPWLPGYEGAKPVRVGNAAHAQLQLDALGEVLNALQFARVGGLTEADECWPLERDLVQRLETLWSMPDHGLWEVRGPPQHFTHSKVMAWVGIDRAIASAGQFGLAAPLDRWRALRARIHDDVCANAYDPRLGTFVQAYGSKFLDATSLLMPLVGFLPATDERVRRTIEAIERRLVVDDLVVRYDPEFNDGLPPGQGSFIACSFWLVEALSALGRFDDARSLFERLLALRNDVGLLAEQYDVLARRQTGNFPQGFSHVALISAAFSLSRR